MACVASIYTCRNTYLYIKESVYYICRIYMHIYIYVYIILFMWACLLILINRNSGLALVAAART